MDEVEEVARKVLNAAFDLHKALGPGLLESAYQSCLYADLLEMGLHVEKEKALPIDYKGLQIEQGYRIDLLVENCLVVELKAVESLMDKHVAQVLTYLRLGDYRLGLLLNFNERLLKHGVKRIVY